MAGCKSRTAHALCLVWGLILAACVPMPPATVPALLQIAITATVPPTSTPAYDVELFATREPFPAGQRLPYTVQGGDTVLALAAHFNTTPEEIVAANPSLSLTDTLTPGLSIEVPAYWFALGGTRYQIIPDGKLVYGPDDRNFDIDAYVPAQPGYLKQLSGFVAGRHRTSAQTVLYVSRQYSINPRLLLALVEWRTGALTQPGMQNNPFGPIAGASGLYGQLRYVAEQLSAGYYGWRAGTLTSILLRDSTRSRVDMYQNAGTVALHYLFAQWFGFDEFQAGVSPQGFAATYHALWGDPFGGDPPPADVIAGKLAQPELALPFPAGQTWAFTGGPHPGWGTRLPWSALDLAPPSGVTGCINTDKWVTAAADGVVVRSEDNTVVLDLDGDGYEQTGWVLFHYHMADRDRIAAGTVVNVGDPLGHPSCEGGRATGSHLHIARKYNGEWIPADGILPGRLPGIVPFTIGGWTAVRGEAPYLGRMTRIGAWVEACTCSTARNTVYWAR